MFLFKELLKSLTIYCNLIKSGPNYPTFGSKRNFNEIEGDDQDVEMRDQHQSSPPPHQGSYNQMDIDQINDQPFSEDEEADEVKDLDEEEVHEREEEGDGDDLEDYMDQDYKQVKELDRYENEGIDDQD